MENSRDSSVWRSLAVAFGDGLAFGVGMNLTQKAGHRGAPPQLETGDLAERLEELEQRLAQVEKTPARLEPKVLEAIVNALEARLREQDGQWAGRLASSVESVTQAARREGEEKAAAVRRENVNLVAALRQSVLEDLRALEGQAVSFQEEMADTLPRAVEERVSARLEARAGEIEERLRQETRQSAELATARAAEALDSAIERKFASWRILLEHRGQEIAELREGLAASERRTRDLLRALGEICHTAAQRMGAPPSGDASKDEAQPAEPAPSATPPETPPDDPPRFGVEPAQLWRIPLVSSLLVACGCLIYLHWL
jgi:hypothetical protein